MSAIKGIRDKLAKKLNELEGFLSIAVVGACHKHTHILTYVHICVSTGHCSTPIKKREELSTIL